jgi:hypothetical protein
MLRRVSADDPDVPRILAAARAQRARYRWSLVIWAVTVPAALYRPIEHAHWGLVAGASAFFCAFLAIMLAGRRLTSPAAPALRALVDEPARVAAIQVRGRTATVYLDARTFTILRLDGDLAERLRARCPQAIAGRPR